MPSVDALNTAARRDGQREVASERGSGGGAPAAGGGGLGAHGLLFDLSGIELSSRILTRKELERWNPHRDHMALVDAVVWQSADYKRGVGIKHIRGDEFWVSGHFPGRPMLPGVMMIEAAAQLAVYLYNVRQEHPKIAAFTRIEDASFRSSVTVGDDLYLLCQEVKWSRRGFTCDVQGVVNSKVAFGARIHGLSIGEHGA